MADQQNQATDPISESWDRNIKLRNDLASRAGKPDNLEIKPLDAPKQLVGSGASAVGTGIKELSLGDVARAGETVQKGSMLSEGVNWLAGKAADTFLSPENAAQAKMAAAAATGLADGENINRSDEETNKAVNTIADTADIVVKPVAQAIGSPIKDAGDWVKGTVSDQGKEAMNRQFFTEDKSGSLHAGDAWTADPAVWAMKMSDVIGTVGGTLVVGGAVKGGVKAAVTRSMLKRGAPEAYAAQVAELTAQRIGEKAAFSTGAAMSVGQTADQTRESVKSLSFEELMNSDSFKQNVQLVNQDPQYQSLSSSDRLDLARQRTADMAADYAKSDPTTYAAAAAGTWLGDAMLFKMITGKAGASAVTGNLLSRAGKGFAKGGLVEGVGEAAEEGAQQNIQNRSDNAVAGTNIDPMQGVKQSAAEAGLLGVMSGGGIGAGSSAVHGSNNPAQTSDGAEQTGDFSPDLQSAAESNSPDPESNSQPSDDLLNTPAYQRQGNISPELQAATQQVNAEQQQFKQALAAEENGVLAPIEKTVTGNPDEPAFLRTQQNNPTGRDPSELQDANPYTDVQQALSQGATKTPEQLISEAKLSQGKTASESELTGNMLLADSQPSAPIPINNDGVTIDGQANEVIPESRGIGYTGTINMPGTGGDGVNSNYIPPVTANRISADQSLGIESTRDPRSPVAQSIDSAGNQANDIFSQLQTLRVTKRGKPFASQKEALLASRKTETPIELPTGGFGVVDKAELEQVQSNISKQEATQYSRETAPAPDVNSIVNDISVGLPDGTKTTVGEQNTNQSSSSQAITPVIDVNDANASYINQPADSAIKNVLGVKTEKQSNNDGSSTYRFSFNDGHASVLTHSDGTAHIMDVQIGDGETAGLRGKGVGTKLYEHIGNELAKDGVTLESTRWSKHKSAISPAALRVWEKLEKAGAARVVGHENARVLDRFSGVNEVRDIPIYEFTSAGKEASQATVKQIDANESTSTPVVAQNQPNINDNTTEISQSPIKQIAEQQNQHGSDSVPPDASVEDGVAAVQQQDIPSPPIAPVQFETVDNPDGTMLIKGDPVELKVWATNNKIKSVHNKAGIVIGKTSVQAAKDLIQSYKNEAATAGNDSPVVPTQDTATPIADQAAVTPSPDTVTPPVVATDSQPTTTPSAGTMVEHKTGKGKVLRGVVRTDLTVDEAKAIDPYTFKKDGGYFIRDKHLDKLPAATESNGTAFESPEIKRAVVGFKDVPPIKNKDTEDLAQKLGSLLAVGDNSGAKIVFDEWLKEDGLSAKKWEVNAISERAKTISDQIKRGDKPRNNQQTSTVDDSMTLDQLKQLRIDTANKINQQEAGNRTVDDRLLRKKDQLDKAIAEAEGTTEKQAAPKEQFADNKLFTADRVAAARARMKSKMGNLNSGLDPEMLVDGMTIAGAYIESGVRNFTTYAKAMTDDFGDGIKPFLLSFWEGVRNYPGLDTKGMTSVEDSAKQHAELASNKPAQASKADTPPTEQPVNRDRQILRDGLHEKLGAGESINNNNDLKRIAAELLGVKTSDLSTMQLKEAQEAYEAAAVRHRRDAIVDVLSRGNGVHEAFQSAVEAYEGQPNLDVRTAKSSDMQAYSTPTPMALLANIAADVWSGKTVFEPTAGNGLLLLTADSKTTYANELDTDRADSLAWSGFNVTVQDATNNPLEGMIPAKVDAVVANPPFGKYRDDNGKPARVEFEDNQGRAYSFGEIDHIIAKNALDGMKDDGKATLILGAPKEAGDYTGNNKVFLNWLYSNYNVVHHIEADGSLFKGQGAGWPTQMIVIDGRAKDGTGKFAPFKGEINRLDSWGKVYDSFNEAGLLDTKGAVFSETAGNGNLHQGYEPVTDLSASQQVSNRGSGVDDLGNGRLGAGKPGRATGNSRSRKLRDGESPAGTFDSQPDLSRHELEPTESRSTTDAGNTEPDKRSDRVGLSGQRNGDAVTDYQKKEISSAITKVNDFQAEYKTASEGFNDGVLTPVNMASYTQTALASIQDRHGSIDKFVADRLGYKSKSELQKAFMGLQADAVALAVDAIEKGRAIIIGDQTGVGKGRQAAGVIRYALEQNKTPIFVTQKPNLFTDMYDDLADIGVKNFKPLIVNQENGFISKGDKTLFNMGTKERQTALNHILKTGQLPDGHNALFLTYSQISSDKNGNKVGLISKLAKNAIMVMDESHTAAGQDSKLGLAFQELVNNVHGLVYLSATYAKRPDNMLLYTRTDLGHAVDNREALVSIISNGGLGMQTYIAGKLAEAGQMVRRERSFDGIEIKNRIIDDKGGDIKRGFDQATTALRAIQDLSAAWRNYVDDVLAKKIQMESGMDTRIAGNQADTKVDVTLFSSVVHNYIAQLSLGLKAKETAKLALEAINRGERPVIALENTMGSALGDYMARTGRRIGDSASDLTYSSLLKSVADDSLAYLVKEAGAKKGEKTYVNIKDIHDPLIQNLYSQVMDAADAMKMDVPASPIDAIRHEIEKAGYTVAEITGRDLMVDYANGSEIKKRPADEKNRRRIVDNFNSKKLDVLILNQAGSTGLSIHASEKFADKSPRHMIVAQPSLDINTFLQMLGRVNRTGQVALPSYSLAWLDLPSEKRPASVLSRKMSSLNANTSGNADSATSIDAVDILNPYGDQVVTSFVEANRELLEQYNPRLVNLPQGDEATYFLGKLAVLPSDVAEQVIGQIEKDYNDLISYLDATGQNELNTKEVDLDAQPVSQRVVSEGRKNAGVFSEPTYATKVDVKAQGKAPKWDEVESALKESSQADFDEAINRMKADNGFANRLQERLKKAQSELDIRKVEGKSTKSEVEKVESIKQLISSHEAEKNNLEYLFSPRGTYHHGAVLRVRLPDSEESVTGILTGLNFENDGGNPAAKSKWRMKIMVADRVRQLPINLSQAESGVIEGGRQDNRYNLQAIFDRAAAMPSREHRYIMTGNLVEAQNRSTEKGRIIPFTTADGRVIQGMLMPKKFDPAAGSMKEEAKVTSTQAFNWLTNTEDKTAASLGLRTPDGDVVLRRLYNGGYELELPKAVSKGKKYWGNPSMVDIIGEQAVKGNGKLNIRLSIEEAKAVNKVMSNINPMTITNQAQIADYNRMTGKKVPTFSDKNIKFSKVPMNAAEQAGKGMKPGEAHLAAKEWLRQFKTDVQVKVAKDQAEFDQLMTEAGQGGTLNADEIANAAYLPESKTLLLNTSAIQNPARLRQLMRHEILGHHGLEYVIGKGAVNDILQILKNGYATSKAIRDAVDTVAANYADADVKTKIKEAFAHYAENRPVDQGPLGRLWDRVVSAVKSALVKAGFIRANEAEKQLDSILKTIAENMRQGRSDNGPNGGTGNKAYFSKGKNSDTSAYGQAGSLLKESGSSLVNWLKQQRGRGLGTLTDLQIDQIYRDITGGAVNRYQKLRTKMESDRNDILLEAETKYDPMWEAMPEKEKAALSQLMHDATMSRLHPDKSLEENSLYQEVKDKLAKARTEKTKAEYQAELDIIRDNYRNLSERYRLSSKQSKELYATMRDLYSAQWEKLRDAISQRIEDQMGEGGKALASQMRLRMEQALRHGPYFPLARFGDYVVKARKDGEYIREHFEKRKDAEAALNQYRRDGYKAVMTVKETSAGDQANAHALGMEVIEALDKAQAEGTAPAELKDTVWQAMLDMLPDSSYAKHAIHRKRIKGASRDGHRAYLQSVYHFAHHVSKIRYGHQMKAELDGMKEQVQLAVQGEESNIKPDEAEIAQQVLNEMNLRHEMNMNPKGSALAGQLGNLGFMFYLGASPASAMVNLTQNVTVMLPQLAGKYGFVKAAKFMLQAMVDYMRHGVFQKGTKEAWVSLTRATNAAITADEKAMLNKLYKAGVLDLTQAHSIAARADTDQQNIKPGKQWARTGMRWAGALFHNAEVLNREVAALTAYRLMKAQQPGIASDVLKGDSAAIDQVAEMVYDGHGNYAASNRPRYMRSDVMKVLTQFKIYSQMMTYTLARNAVLAAKGDKTALKTLGAMFGTTWMMAGMMGMPTPVGLILYGLASLFDDDDDRTGEASFRLGLTEVFGAEVGELIAKGPVDAISGLNISGRTGLSDLWWRSPKEGTEGDDLTFHYMQQVAGPVLGIGVSAVRGMREFANGDIQRGVEAMSPKAVKDLAKAYRQATEGEQTRNGDSVIDDVGAWNVAMQAMGFSSAKMSQVYAARGYIKGKEKVIEDERSNLLADFFDAKRSGDEEAMRDVMERIKAFNSKHDRAETITGRTLMQSIKSRNRSMERTQAGVYLSKKREYLRGEGAFLDESY